MSISVSKSPKKVTIRMTSSRGGNSNLLKSYISVTGKLVEDIISNVHQMSVTTEIGGIRLEEYIKSFGQQSLYYIKDNFLHNPTTWKPLSARTRLARAFLASPAHFYEIVRLQLGDCSAVKKLLGGLEVTKHPNFTPDAPTLLNTGTLMNSAYMEIWKSKKKEAKSTEYIRELKFGFRAQHAKVLFNGGMVYNYNLNFYNTQGGLVASFPLPIQWQRKFPSKQNVTAFNGKQVVDLVMVKERVAYRVKGRNPFIMKPEHSDMLNRSMREFNTIITNDVRSKFINKLKKGVIK